MTTEHHEEDTMINGLSAFPTSLGLWQDGIRNIFEIPCKAAESWQKLTPRTQIALGFAAVATAFLTLPKN